MSWLRKAKFYLALAAFYFPLIAVALLKIVEIISDLGVQLADHFLNISKTNDLLFIALICGFGFAAVLVSKGAAPKFELAHLVGYFALGCGVFCLIFYLAPLLLQIVVTGIVAPLLNTLGEYFGGGAKVSLSGIIQLVFVFYLFNILIDFTIQKYVHKRDISAAIKDLLKRHRKDFIDCILGLSELTVQVFNFFFGRAAKRNGSGD